MREQSICTVKPWPYFSAPALFDPKVERQLTVFLRKTIFFRRVIYTDNKNTQTRIKDKIDLRITPFFAIALLHISDYIKGNSQLEAMNTGI
jgi:hypothetical protein